ncbi:hypothetical protein DFH07DRAFT_947419 [Mycena maculata]|uniref:Uncharacterized protein n=1 Tax=Mycena maculata TaxID=230809 RepID=A0AAD7MHH7_9AGAR|nr:hypothetical protein DFH07DRAFT_947419 [Mycena maculata]
MKRSGILVNRTFSLGQIHVTKFHCRIWASTVSDAWSRSGRPSPGHYLSSPVFPQDSLAVRVRSCAVRPHPHATRIPLEALVVAGVVRKFIARIGCKGECKSLSVQDTLAFATSTGEMRTITYLGVCRCSMLAPMAGFLSPKALSFVQYSLGTTYNGTLGVAAPWADTVHYEAAFSWSASFHSVDAQGWFWHYDSSHLDNPPTSCSVSQTRDYANETCILTAIANYTTRVLDTSLSATQSQDALKFLDTGMINVLLVANYQNSVTTWADDLAKRIKADSSQNRKIQLGTCFFLHCLLLDHNTDREGGYLFAAWLNVFFDGFQHQT